MPKRNTFRASILSASALVTLFLLASLVTGQKTTTTVTGAPLKSVDVKLGKNPGGSPAARTTGPDGKINLEDLPEGSYWLELPPLSREQKAVNSVGEADSYLTVTIRGTRLIGGPKTRSLKVSKWKFVETLPKNSGRTATPVETYTDRLLFELGPSTGVTPPEPAEGSIVKSKSNITNN